MLLQVVVWSSVSLSYGYRYETLHLCRTDTPPSSSCLFVTYVTVKCRMEIITGPSQYYTKFHIYRQLSSLKPQNIIGAYLS